MRPGDRIVEADGEERTVVAVEVYPSGEYQLVTMVKNPKRRGRRRVSWGEQFRMSMQNLAVRLRPGK